MPPTVRDVFSIVQQGIERFVRDRLAGGQREKFHKGSLQEPFLGEDCFEVKAFQRAEEYLARPLMMPAVPKPARRIEARTRKNADLREKLARLSREAECSA